MLLKSFGTFYLKKIKVSHVRVRADVDMFLILKNLSLSENPYPRLCLYYFLD